MTWTKRFALGDEKRPATECRQDQLVGLHRGLHGIEQPARLGAQAYRLRLPCVNAAALGDQRFVVILPTGPWQPEQALPLPETRHTRLKVSFRENGKNKQQSNIIVTAITTCPLTKNKQTKTNENKQNTHTIHK